MDFLNTLRAFHKFTKIHPNPNPSNNFRLVDKQVITSLIDEVEVSFKSNEDLISLVNSGYMKKTANVSRCEGDKHEVKSFQC